MGYSLTRHEKNILLLERMAVDLSPVKSSRIYSMLVKKNEVLSFGYCQRKTHPLQKRHAKNPEAQYLHAEVHAIANAIRSYGWQYLRGSDIYIARVKFTSSKEMLPVRGCACPCSGCRNAIETYDIRNIYYTEDDGSITKESI
jgi:tRNA(Arg) A34 adenosine deaminase TadA